MFHAFTKRLKALCAFVYEFKIIFISCTYIISDAILLKLLRNNFNPPSVLLTLTIFALGLVLLYVIPRLRNISAIQKLTHKRKNTCDKSLIILKALVYTLLISTFCLLRLRPLIIVEKQHISSAQSFTQKYAEFKGVIASESDSKHTYNNVEIKLVEDLVLDENNLDAKHQKILIKTKKYQKFKIGQVCNIKGEFEIPENFEDFNYQEYLRNNEIYLLMEYPEITCNDERKGWKIQNILIDFKEGLIEKIQWKLNEPQSSLLMGILFGQDRLFSESFEKNVRIAGVSHIVAASGYNITILILASSKFLSFLSFKIRFPINLILIWSFSILSGLSPSILRACIMTTIALCGTLLGRKSLVHVTLPLAMFIFVLVDPRIVFNVGFQLSAMATLGLIYLQPSLASLTKKVIKKDIGFVNDTLLTTLSCTLTTLPITMITFRTLSVWSILANCMILPVIESTMILGVLALISGSIIFYEIINVQLMYFELVVNFIGSFDCGYWEFQNICVWIPIAMMTAIIIFCIYLYPVKDENSNYYIKICS